MFPVTIPASHRYLFEQNVIASLSTLMPDGQPQVHPVWCDFDGEYVRVNTAKGRQKDHNLLNRRKATILLLNPKNGYHGLEIRGEVETRIEGTLADVHINSLALKYTGDPYPFDLKVTRVMYRIRPNRILPIDLTTRFQPPSLSLSLRQT